MSFFPYLTRCCTTCPSIQTAITLPILIYKRKAEYVEIKYSPAVSLLKYPSLSTDHTPIVQQKTLKQGPPLPIVFVKHGCLIRKLIEINLVHVLVYLIVHVSFLTRALDGFEVEVLEDVPDGLDDAIGLELAPEAVVP